MDIEVIVAKAHQNQLADEQIKREVESVENAVKMTELELLPNTVNFLFIRGIYKHSERKMITAGLFINQMPETLVELHGELRLKFAFKTAQIAKTTIDFDELFMGEVGNNQGVLVHLGIPVKGLEKDACFTGKDVFGTFDDVRVTPKKWRDNNE